MLVLLLFCGLTISCLAAIPPTRLPIQRRENTCNGRQVAAGYQCFQQQGFQDLLCTTADGACGNTCYNSNDYVCADQANSIACPKANPALCGIACYNDAAYHCNCGELISGPRSGPENLNCPPGPRPGPPQPPSQPPYGSPPPLPPPPPSIKYATVTVTQPAQTTTLTLSSLSTVTQANSAVTVTVTSTNFNSTTATVTLSANASTVTTTATITSNIPAPSAIGYDTIDLFCLPQAVINGYKMSYANYGYLQVLDSSSNVLGYAGMVDLQLRYLSDSIDGFAYYADDHSLSVYGYDYGVGIGPSVNVQEGSAANVLYFGAVGCNNTWNYNQTTGLSYKGYNLGADSLKSPNSGQFIYLYLGATPPNVEPISLVFVEAALLPASNDKRNASFAVARQLWTKGWF